MHHLRTPIFGPCAEGLHEALVARAGGDEAPLGRWFESGYPALVASLETAGWDPASADDSAALVVDRMDRAVSSGTEIRSVPAYMATVAFRIGLDMARKERLHGRPVPAPPSPRDSHPGSEVLSRIARAALRLRPRYRDGVILRYVAAIPLSRVVAIPAPTEANAAGERVGPGVTSGSLLKSELRPCKEELALCNDNNHAIGARSDAVSFGKNDGSKLRSALNEAIEKAKQDARREASKNHCPSTANPPCPTPNVLNVTWVRYFVTVERRVQGVYSGHAIAFAEVRFACTASKGLYIPEPGTPTPPDTGGGTPTPPDHPRPGTPTPLTRMAGAADPVSSVTD